MTCPSTLSSTNADTALVTPKKARKRVDMANIMARFTRTSFHFLRFERELVPQVLVWSKRAVQLKAVA